MGGALADASYTVPAQQKSSSLALPLPLPLTLPFIHTPEHRLQQNAGPEGFSFSYWNSRETSGTEVQLASEEEKDIIHRGSTEEYLAFKLPKWVVVPLRLSPPYMCVHACEFTAEAAAALQMPRSGTLLIPLSPPPILLLLISSSSVRASINKQGLFPFLSAHWLCMLHVFVREQNRSGHTWTQQLQGGLGVRLIFLASWLMCALVRYKSSSPLVVFELFPNDPLSAGLHLAPRSTSVDSLVHPSLFWGCPTPSPSALLKYRMTSCAPLCWGGGQQYGHCAERHPHHHPLRHQSATVTLPHQDGHSPRPRWWAKTLTPPQLSTTTASSPTTTMWLKVRRWHRKLYVSVLCIEVFPSGKCVSMYWTFGVWVRQSAWQN